MNPVVFCMGVSVQNDSASTGRDGSLGYSRASAASLDPAHFRG